MRIAAVVSAVALAACASSGTSKAPAPTEASAGTAFIPVTIVPGGDGVPTVLSPGGSCVVEVSGDVATTFRAAGESAAMVYGPWVAATGATVPDGPTDETLFVMSCLGPDDEVVTFTTASGADGAIASLPMHPAVYPLTSAVPDAVDAGSAVLTAAVFLPGRFSWAVDAGSTIEITRFDSDGIAGSFTLAIAEVRTLLDDEGVPAFTATVTGSFEFVNPG
jgi:hypothetical protein